MGLSHRFILGEIGRETFRIHYAVLGLKKTKGIGITVSGDNRKKILDCQRLAHQVSPKEG